jgi:hypothetical protein
VGSRGTKGPGNWTIPHAATDADLGLDSQLVARHISSVNRDLEPNRGGRIPFLANLLILLSSALVLSEAQTNDFLNDTRGGHWLAKTKRLGVWWCESGWKVRRERALPEPPRGKPKPVSVVAACGEYEPVQVILRPEQDVQ